MTSVEFREFFSQPGAAPNFDEPVPTWEWARVCLVVRSCTEGVAAMQTQPNAERNHQTDPEPPRQG